MAAAPKPPSPRVSLVGDIIPAGIPRLSLSAELSRAAEACTKAATTTAPSSGSRHHPLAGGFVRK